MKQKQQKQQQQQQHSLKGFWLVILIREILPPKEDARILALVRHTERSWWRLWNVVGSGIVAAGSRSRDVMGVLAFVRRYDCFRVRGRPLYMLTDIASLEGAFIVAPIGRTKVPSSAGLSTTTEEANGLSSWLGKWRCSSFILITLESRVGPDINSSCCMEAKGAIDVCTVVIDSEAGKWPCSMKRSGRFKQAGRAKPGRDRKHLRLSNSQTRRPVLLKPQIGAGAGAISGGRRRHGASEKLREGAAIGIRIRIGEQAGDESHRARARAEPARPE
ncbi:hypothetical protein V2J09_012959 [Rumex salicifolius]